MSHLLDGFNRGKNCVIAHCSCGRAYYAAIGTWPVSPEMMIAAPGDPEWTKHGEAVDAIWEAATEAARTKWEDHVFTTSGGVIYPNGDRVMFL